MLDFFRLSAFTRATLITGTIAGSSACAHGSDDLYASAHSGKEIFNDRKSAAPAVRPRHCEIIASFSNLHRG